MTFFESLRHFKQIRQNIPTFYSNFTRFLQQNVKIFQIDSKTQIHVELFRTISKNLIVYIFRYLHIKKLFYREKIYYSYSGRYSSYRL
jgi:hypothetical protein